MDRRPHPPLPDLDWLIAQIYGSLSEELDFRLCLEIVGHALRCHISGLHHENPLAGISSLEAAGQVTARELRWLEDDYSRNWRGENLWLLRSLDRMLRMGYSNGDDVVSQSELVAMPYYQGFLKRIDIRHGLGFRLWNDASGNLAVASFNRSRAEGPFDARTMALVAALSPHMANAYALHRRMCGMQLDTLSMRAAMECATTGIVLLSENCVVVYGNDAALRWLQPESGAPVSLHRGMLRLGQRLQNATLVRHVLQLAHGQGAPKRSMLALDASGDPARGIALHLCALPTRSNPHPDARDGGHRRVVAFLNPMLPDDHGEIDVELLRSTLGLTRMEAEVLRLLHAHHDTHATAMALGIGMTTVRTHLKHAFEKTGTNRQSELLCMVDRLIASTPIATPSHASANPPPARPPPASASPLAGRTQPRHRTG